MSLAAERSRVTPLEPKGPNAEQIKFWNEAGISLAHAPVELRPLLEDAMREALGPYLTEAGVLMESATRLVSARSP